MSRVAVLGRGRLGRGLHRALSRAGVDATLASGRATAPRTVRAADVLVLAVPDDRIAEAASRLSPWLRPGAVVLHCAGARGPSELSACRTAGAAVGVLHPLASFATRPRDLGGATFVLAGDARAVAAGRRLARAVGARALLADVHGPAYHAAAALVANGAAALAAAGVEVLERVGIARRDAERALGGLLRTVADNVEAVGVPASLTGPVARGDAATVAGHRAALEATAPAVRPVYDALAPVILSVALAAGLSASGADAIRRALRISPATRSAAPGRARRASRRSRSG